MAERKVYTEEQKAAILKKAEETSMLQASKEFGVSRMTIAAWKKAAEVKGATEKVEKKVKADAKKAEKAVKEAAMKAEEKIEETAAVAEIEGKKTTRKGGRKAKEAVENVVADVKEEAGEAALVAEIEAGKAKAKRTRKKAEAEEKIEDAVKAPARKAKAAKLNINIQSPLGGVITPEEVAAKVPKEATDVYIRVDENKIYWVSKNGVGSVDIWE